MTRMWLRDPGLGRFLGPSLGMSPRGAGLSVSDESRSRVYPRLSSPQSTNVLTSPPRDSCLAGSVLPARNVSIPGGTTRMVTALSSPRPIIAVPAGQRKSGRWLDFGSSGTVQTPLEAWELRTNGQNLCNSVRVRTIA